MVGAPRAAFRTLYRRSVATARGRRIFRHAGPVEWREVGGGSSRRCCGHRRCRWRCSRGVSEMAGTHCARPRPLSLRTGAARAKTFPAPRGSRNHGQRKADPREPRHRYSARSPAFLLPRWLGTVVRARVPRIRTLRRGGSDYSVELSAPHAGVEDRTGAGDGKHGGLEARGVYSAYGARVR